MVWGKSQVILTIQVKPTPYFPIHYVVGWLAKIFPALYSQQPDSECPIVYHALIRYAGMSAKRFTLAQARTFLEMGNPSLFTQAHFCSSHRKDGT